MRRAGAWALAAGLLAAGCGGEGERAARPQLTAATFEVATTLAAATPGAETTTASSSTTTATSTTTSTSTVAPTTSTTPSTSSTTTSSTTTVPSPLPSLDVMIVGDSMAWGLRPPLEAALAPSSVGFRWIVGFLFEESAAEWDVVFADPPDVIVVMFAAWENAVLRAGDVELDATVDPAWRDTYLADHLQPWVDRAEANGSMVVWVGVPLSRDEPRAGEHQELNDVWRTLAERNDSVDWVDGASVLASDSEFAELDTTTDPPTRLFNLDGLHLCPEAAERLAIEVLAQIASRHAATAPDGWQDGAWRADEQSYIPGECPAPA